MKKCLSFILALLILSFSVHAAEFSAKYDIDNFSLSIQGTSAEPVTVTISKAGESVSSSNLYGIVEFDYHTEKNFTESISIKNNLTSDKLDVHIKNGKESKTFPVIYINNNDGLTLKSDINTALSKDKDALKTAISDNSAILGMEKDEFKGDIAEYISNRIYTYQNGENITSINDFYSQLSEGKITYLLKDVTTVDGLTTYLSTNEDGLEIDVDKYYKNISEDAKTSLLSLLKKDDMKDLRFKDSFKRKSALSVIATADRWETIKQAVTVTYSDVLGIDVESVENSDEIFAKMMEYTYDEYSDISENFSSADTFVNGEDDPPSGDDNFSGGGGGGGGGSSSVGSMGTAPDIEEISFYDVDSTHWAYNQIKYLAEEGIVSGYENGTFLPSKSITREEFVKIIACAFNLNATEENIFSDVPVSLWSNKYITAAYKYGVVNGVTKNSFNPQGLITREDAATILYRLMVKKGVSFTNAPKSFDDKDKISDYALQGIEMLYGNGIVNGVTYGNFNPKDELNRASCVMLVYNSLNLL